jgi:hypothetical protein
VLWFWVLNLELREQRAKNATPATKFCEEHIFGYVLPLNFKKRCNLQPWRNTKAKAKHSLLKHHPKPRTLRISLGSDCQLVKSLQNKVLVK